MSVEIPSYARAAAQFSELTHVNLSKSSLQELVNAYGGRLVARQAHEAQAMVEIPHEETEVVWREIAEPPSEVMNISMDGAMVNIRGEGWKEVKAVAVAAIGHLLDTVTGKVTPLLSDHSYRAGLWDATEFCQQQWAEACRRGVEKVGYLSSVNDGAAWIWNIVRKATHYLFHNRRRMRYHLFREAGYPIGSGTVESACKLVVQQRLKQSGMRWSRHGAQAMLALRATLLSQPSLPSLPLLGLA